MNNIQERMMGSALDPFVEETAGAGETVRRTFESPAGRIRRDAVNVLQPPTRTIPLDGETNILAQLGALIQQLLSSFGRSYFANATASSTGDPHLAFDGTGARGDARHARFDSMQGHHDLLDSDSFAGGYRISTQVTQPGTNGVTYNREATISTNFGSTRVSLDNSGNARIVSGHEGVTLAQGQSVDLGNGESVMRNMDGSLTITEDNGMGSVVTTRLSQNGPGVDVKVQAQNVALGGDLVNEPVAQPRLQM